MCEESYFIDERHCCTNNGDCGGECGICGPNHRCIYLDGRCHGRDNCDARRCNRTTGKCNHHKNARGNKPHSDECENGDPCHDMHCESDNHCKIETCSCGDCVIVDRCSTGDDCAGRFCESYGRHFECALSSSEQSSTIASNSAESSSTVQSSTVASSGTAQSSTVASSGTAQSSTAASSGAAQSSTAASSGAAQSSALASSGTAQSSTVASSGAAQSSALASSGTAQSSALASSGTGQSSIPSETSSSECDEGYFVDEKRCCTDRGDCGGECAVCGPNHRCIYLDNRCERGENCKARKCNHTTGKCDGKGPRMDFARKDEPDCHGEQDGQCRESECESTNHCRVKTCSCGDCLIVDMCAPGDGCTGKFCASYGRHFECGQSSGAQSSGAPSGEQSSIPSGERSSGAQSSGAPSGEQSSGASSGAQSSGASSTVESSSECADWYSIDDSSCCTDNDECGGECGVCGPNHKCVYLDGRCNRVEGHCGISRCNRTTGKCMRREEHLRGAGGKPPHDEECSEEHGNCHGMHCESDNRCKIKTCNCGACLVVDKCAQGDSCAGRFCASYGRDFACPAQSSGTSLASSTPAPSSGIASSESSDSGSFSTSSLSAPGSSTASSAESGSSKSSAESEASQSSTSAEESSSSHGDHSDHSSHSSHSDHSDHDGDSSGSGVPPWTIGECCITDADCTTAPVLPGAARNGVEQRCGFCGPNNRCIYLDSLCPRSELLCAPLGRCNASTGTCYWKHLHLRGGDPDGCVGDEKHHQHHNHQPECIDADDCRRTIADPCRVNACRDGECVVVDECREGARCNWATKKCRRARGHHHHHEHGPGEDGEDGECPGDDDSTSGPGYHIDESRCCNSSADCGGECGVCGPNRYCVYVDSMCADEDPCTLDRCNVSTGRCVADPAVDARCPVRKNYGGGHWDSDEAFVTGQPFYGKRVRAWVEHPPNLRLFHRYVRELVRLTSQEPERLAAWLAAERTASAPAVIQANYANFFRRRAAEAEAWLTETERELARAGR